MIDYHKPCDRDALARGVVDWICDPGNLGALFGNEPGRHVPFARWDRCSTTLWTGRIFGTCRRALAFSRGVVPGIGCEIETELDEDLRAEFASRVSWRILANEAAAESIIAHIPYGSDDILLRLVMIVVSRIDHPMDCTYGRG